MGGFYGSVQVRCGDRARVIAAVEEVARENEIRCLVGPVIRGWVGVYPEHNGQDYSIGGEIAAEVGGVALHLMVHDDDVMAYWLWEEGELVDWFWSRPGYFGEETRAEQEPMKGDAKALARVLGGSERGYADLLGRGERAIVMEHERLKRFGEVSGIANLLTAYEYLKAGETEEVEGWEELVEVPAEEVEAERAEERRLKKAQERARRKLKERGMLLVEEGHGRQAFACAAGSGFVVAWLRGGDGVESRCFKKPWENPQKLELGSRVHAFVSNPGGALIAVTNDKGVNLYREGSWERIAELSGEGGPVAAISPDGTKLARTSSESLTVCDLSGTPIGQWKLSTPDLPVFHPDGRWLLARCGGSLAIVDALNPSAPPRRRLVGGKWAAGEEMAASFIEQAQSIDMEEMEREQRKGLEQAMAMMEKSGMPREQIEQARAQMESAFAEARASLQSAKDGIAAAPARGEEVPLSILFSRDGRTLWCGTDQGVRGYNWQEVLEADPDDMPAARWAHEPAGLNQQGARSSFVHALAQEPGSDAVVFGGLADEVMRLDPSNGEVRSILKLKQGCTVSRLLFSGDGTALGMNCLLQSESGKESRSVWQVWAYGKLRQ